MVYSLRTSPLDLWVDCTNCMVAIEYLMYIYIYIYSWAIILGIIVQFVVRLSLLIVATIMCLNYVNLLPVLDQMYYGSLLLS